MMKLLKIIFSIIAITMALALILTPQNPDHEYHKPATTFKPAKPVRVSRFLQQNGRNPRILAENCNKDNEVCNYTLEGGRNATCCSNKCIDLWYDSQNCGACNNQCKFTDTCCNGECVTLAYDKRHCGTCNHKCMNDGYCIYGICDYA